MMHRGTFHICLLLLGNALFTGPARAEVSFDQNFFQNQKQNVLESAQEDDRRRKAEEAARQGSQVSKQQLTPPMIQHMQKSMEHKQKAQEARQNKDEGTAQKEEKMAQMEQQKSQQLKQQIDANQKSADQNKNAANQMSKNLDEPGKQEKGKDPNTITVDKDRRDKREGPANEALAASQAPPPVSQDQLVSLDKFQMEKSALDPFVPPAKAEPPESGKGATAAEPGGDRDRVGVMFNDGAPVNHGGGGGSPSVANTNPAPSGGAAPIAAPTAPQDRLLSSGMDPEGKVAADGTVLSQRVAAPAGVGPKILPAATGKSDGKADDLFTILDREAKKKAKEGGDEKGKRRLADRDKRRAKGKDRKAGKPSGKKPTKTAADDSDKDEPNDKPKKKKPAPAERLANARED